MARPQPEGCSHAAWQRGARAVDGRAAAAHGPLTPSPRRTRRRRFPIDPTCRSASVWRFVPPARPHYQPGPPIGFGGLIDGPYIRDFLVQYCTGIVQVTGLQILYEYRNTVATVYGLEVSTRTGTRRLLHVQLYVRVHVRSTNSDKVFTMLARFR